MKNITSMAVTVNACASSVLSTELETFSLRKCGNSLYIWHTKSRLDVSCFSSCHGLTAQSVTYIKRKTKRHDVALLNCLCKSEGIITILSHFDIRNALLVFVTDLIAIYHVWWIQFRDTLLALSFDKMISMHFEMKSQKGQELGQ